MLQDEAEGPGTPRRSTPTTTATSGLPYLPANPYPDDAFRTPVRPTSTGTATSTSPQPRTTQGRQGLARQEDVWSQDAETAIFSIYSMYGVSVRDSVVPGETSIQQPTRQSIVDTPSTSTTTPLRASQIGPTDVVHPLGGTFPGTSAALHGRYQQHQYHDRRPTKEQFEAFSFGSSGQPAPRQISRFSEDTSSTGITRESMYSSDTAHFDTGAGFVPGSSSPPTSGDEGRPVSMVSEEGTIESAVVMRVPGSTNSANPPPSAFHLDGQDWVSANPRLSFQLGTVLTAPAAQYDAEGRQGYWDH
ncbi:hypothetical protein BKA70DRAFT_310490 [Coprinopsis sp. MPI-PUGE-AT-0042]|nr:hypothetical protein BKA70DRAFT_310490 [Coprinopsis sp. MPI-PUGE-AT-0042]